MSGAVKDPLRALQGARSRAQGGQLEERIEASCTRLAEAGRADISKTPEPMRPVSQPNKRASSAQSTPKRRNQTSKASCSAAAR